MNIARATRKPRYKMEACLLFPTLDALNEGYVVYSVVDAVGGTILAAHQAALVRMSEAGARLTSWNSLLCELQRDWNRKETNEGFVKGLIEHGALGWFFDLEKHRQVTKRKVA